MRFYLTILTLASAALAACTPATVTEDIAPIDREQLAKSWACEFNVIKDDVHQVSTSQLSLKANGDFSSFSRGVIESDGATISYTTEARGQWAVNERNLFTRISRSDFSLGRVTGWVGQEYSRDEITRFYEHQRAAGLEQTEDTGSPIVSVSGSKLTMIDSGTGEPFTCERLKSAEVDV